MSQFTPVSALAGGVLIALGLAVMLVGGGRIAGISGVVGGLVKPEGGDGSWRLRFLLAMIAGGVVVGYVLPGTFEAASSRPAWVLMVSGLLVGFGTRLANGCTSGHGICGMSRLSKRSIVATMVFMATGIGAAVVSGRVWGRA